jgi:hypothetical protein
VLRSEEEGHLALAAAAVGREQPPRIPAGGDENETRAVASGRGTTNEQLRKVIHPSGYSVSPVNEPRPEVKRAQPYRFQLEPISCERREICRSRLSSLDRCSFEQSSLICQARELRSTVSSAGKLPLHGSSARRGASRVVFFFLRSSRFLLLSF